MNAKVFKLNLGQLHLSDNGDEIQTILNNSTIVCVYDLKLKYIGVCHFLLPNEAKAQSYGKKNLNPTPFYYGDFAIPTLLGLFKKKGSDRGDLEVSILGSSTVNSQDLENKSASENILCAENWIQKFNLKLKQKKTGLPSGMLVKMMANTGNVFLKHVSTQDSIEKANRSISVPTQSVAHDRVVKPKLNSGNPSSEIQIVSNTIKQVSTSQNESVTKEIKSHTSPTIRPLIHNTHSKATTLSVPQNQNSNTKSNTNSPSTSSFQSKNSQSTLDQPKSIKTSEKIKVLIVDDSKTIRTLLSSVLETASNMEVVGQAADAFEAESLRVRLNPDVMTLDIHMPEKDGVTYLEEILNKEPIPVVMVSDLSLKEASPVMKALEIGAFDYFQKPAASDLATQGPELITMIKTAFENKDKIKTRCSERKKKQTIITNKKSLPPSLLKVDPSIRLLAIGSSTGGPDAVRAVLSEFPEKCPPTIIVQHMPPKFTKTFSESLNLTSRVKVKEAEDGDKLEDSTVYIAPGGLQMAIEEKNGQLFVSLKDDPPVNRFKPSVDYTFNTLEKIDFKGNLRAAILTGMGSDGAYGLLGLRRKGNYTIAQDESTCVVYGMPRAAVEFKAVEVVLPLNQIADSLLSVKKRNSAQTA